MIDDRTERLRADLIERMREAGEEVDSPLDEGEESGEGFLSCKVKLVSKPGDETMLLVLSEEDWLHDALDEFVIIPGTIYAFDELFVEGSAALTGYFQDDETGRWLHIDEGRVVCADSPDALDAAGAPRAPGAPGAPGAPRAPRAPRATEDASAAALQHAPSPGFAYSAAVERLPWKPDLLEFEEVAVQLEECMKVPRYRHAVEKTLLKEGMR